MSLSNKKGTHLKKGCYNNDMRKIGNKTTETLLNILELQVTFLVSLLIMVLVVHFIALPIQIDGDSMKPTLYNEDFGISSIWAKNHEQLEYGDVVIVKVNDELWVKRVIGLPNDTVSCKENQVYVNGGIIKEDYLDQSYVKQEIAEHGYFTQDFDEITLRDDEVYLMGDNRIHSLDSRIIGPFKLSQVMAKDVYIIWPMNHGKVVK